MPTLTEPSVGSPPPLIPLPPSGGDGGRGGNDPADSGSAARIGICVGMVASTMTFAALIAAMVVRRKLGGGWKHVPIPAILWWNTAALLLSSVAVDIGRRALRAGHRPEFTKLWRLGTLLGTLFLAGQAAAWMQLSGEGFYLQRNPSSAFFYVLTWAHAAHVVGALAALYFVAIRDALRPDETVSRTVVGVSAIFWHFLDVMWLILIGLFAFWS